MDRKLPPDVDYDLFGHCVKCHKNMTKEVVIDGKVHTLLTGEYTEAEYLLDTGSMMRVAMCKKCKAALENTPEEFDKIMNTVIKGWEIEASDLVADPKKTAWTKEVKKKYMDDQSKKSIISNIEGLRKSTVQDTLKKYKEKKEKENGNKTKAK